MIYLLIAQLVSLLLDLFATSQRSECHKDIQILLLRQQLRILQRQHQQKPNVSRLEKLTLAVLASKLTGPGCGVKAKLGETLLLFKPDTPWLCREPWS